MDTRLWTALALYAYGVCGAFLLFSPWTASWDSAAHALLPGDLRVWVLSGWFRGVVTALGALDLLVALSVALRLWGRGESTRRAARSDERR